MFQHYISAMFLSLLITSQLGGAARQKDEGWQAVWMGETTGLTIPELAAKAAAEAKEATTRSSPIDLVTAIKNGDIGTVRAALTRTIPNASHMALAAELSSSAIIKLLVANGAPLDELDTDQLTPLGRAALKGKHDAVIYFCQADVRINTLMRSKSTPLHAAAICGCPKIIATLLEHGADPSAQDHLGRTPLHRALEKGKSDAAIALIKTGKALHITNNEGDDALKLAQKYRLSEATKCILEHCFFSVFGKTSPDMEK